MDFRIVRPGERVETDASRAAREAAAALGTIEGSSYSTFEGRPVRWAFDVDGGRHRLILAGAESAAARVVLIAGEEHAFTCMLYGKAIAATSWEPIAPHVVTQIDEVPPEAGWYCDSFYLSRHRVDAMADADVVAVALHADEAGMSPDAAEASVGRRSIDMVSTPDRNARYAAFPGWVRLVRSTRRLARLRELGAPDIIIQREIGLGARLWQSADVRALAAWPDDLRALAAQLGYIE